jgi:hypothetical protein
MKFSEIKKWGVDIGNVIIKNGSYVEPWKMENIQLIPDCLIGVKFLIDKVGSDNVWIISKASLPQQNTSKQFLNELGFHKEAGLKYDHVLFCLERLEKAPIIKELNIQGHLDDRGEIIESIQKSITCPIWFNPDPEDYHKWNCRIDNEIPIINSWKEFMENWDK